MCVPDIICSHLKAVEYWIEALKNSTSFVGVRCSSYEQFFDKNCDDSIKAYMAYDYKPYSRVKEGKYYLQTRFSSPHGLGDEETSPVNGKDVVGTSFFNKNLVKQFENTLANMKIIKDTYRYVTLYLGFKFFRK